MIGLWVHVAAGVDLDAILNDVKLSGAIVSATVTDAKGKVLYEHLGSTHMTPASNQKLLSNSFALYELGPDFRPRTRFWFTDRRTVIDSEGDPMLTYSDLAKVVERFHPDGSKPVEVRQIYSPGYPDSWEIDDIPGRYAAPVTSLTFDRATFQLEQRSGHPVLAPRDFGVKIVQAPGKSRQIRYDPFAKTVTVAGPPAAKDGVLDVLSLPRPDLAAASLFGRSVRSTASVPDSIPDAVIDGHTVREIVEACLPPSDNNLAEHLFLLGASHLGPISEDPYVLARKRMTAFLTRVVQVDPADFHVYDGSGMSRHNYVTTRGLCRLLAWADGQPTSALWHGAMARPGKGTLARRLDGVVFEGKTGSLDMVAALSGYLTTKNGEHRIVSVIVNGYGCSAAETRAAIDSFVRAVSVTGP